MTFRIGTGRRPLGAVVLAALLTAAAALVGCTSDDPGPVGADLTGDLDLNEPQVVRVAAFTEWGSVAVSDPDRPLSDLEMLYLGERDAYASSVLAWYPLADSLPADTYTLTPAAGMRLRFFISNQSDHAEGDLDLEISSLADTFDVAAYPGPAPLAQIPLGGESGPDEDFVTVDINTAAGKQWIVDRWAAGEPVPMIFELLGADTMIPYASRELQLYSEIALEDDQTIVGPTLTVSLPGDTITIPPARDISTLHAWPAQDTGQQETFFLRTHLRVCPWFLLDTSAIPAGVRINRAVLRLGVDPDACFGPPESLVLSEVPYAWVAGADTLTLDALVDSLAVVDGNANVNPADLPDQEEPLFGFDLTDLAQRVANGVLTGPVALILTAGEDGLDSSFDVALRDPEFYLTHFQFRGPAAAAYAPTLEITYTEFTGGGR